MVPFSIEDYFGWKDLDLLLSSYASLKGMMDLVYSGIGMCILMPANTPLLQVNQMAKLTFNAKLAVITNVQNKTFLRFF